MAKIIEDDQFAIVIEFVKNELGEIETKCQAQYRATSEGITERRTQPIDLTQEQIDVAKKFGKTVLRIVEAKERN